MGLVPTPLGFRPPGWLLPHTLALQGALAKNDPTYMELVHILLASEGRGATMTARTPKSTTPVLLATSTGKRIN